MLSQHPHSTVYSNVGIALAITSDISAHLYINQLRLHGTITVYTFVMIIHLHACTLGCGVLTALDII